MEVERLIVETSGFKFTDWYILFYVYIKLKVKCNESLIKVIVN